MYCKLTNFFSVTHFSEIDSFDLHAANKTGFYELSLRAFVYPFLD